MKPDVDDTPETVSIADVFTRLGAYLHNPDSDFGATTQERVLARLESDVTSYFEWDHHHPSLMVVLTRMLDEASARDALLDLGFLDG